MNEANETMIPEELSEDILAQELAALKLRADQIGIKYHPSIGLENLQKKVADAVAVDEGIEDNGTEEKVSTNTPASQNPSLKQVRVRISCMDPAKKSWTGEIFTTGNSKIATVRKMVPYEKPFHVPQIILNMIRQRKHQLFYDFRLPNGKDERRSRLVNTFSVEVLDPLTEKELHELKQRQLMSLAA